jgi:hypothetical protein
MATSFNLGNLLSVESLAMVGLFSVLADPKVMSHIEKMTGLHGMSVSLATGFVFVAIMLMLLPALTRIGVANQTKFLGTQQGERVQWSKSATGTGAAFSAFP